MQPNHKVRSVMTERVICVSPYDTINKAYRIMKQYGFRHLPVTDDEQLVGILSDRDILLQARDGNGKVIVPGLSVEYVMTPEPYTCRADTPLTDVAYTLVVQKIDCMPVITAQGRLIGIITSSDILKLYSGGQYAHAAAASAALSAV